MARIGLVLGAGGMTGGAFHAGVLSTLAEELGSDARTAEVIVGTSAGSLAGAVLRAGLPPTDLAARALGRSLSAAGQHVMAGVGPPPTSFPLHATRLHDLARSGPRGGTHDARQVSGSNSRAAGRRGPAEIGALARAAMRPWSVRPMALAAALLPEGRLPTSMIADGLGPLFGASWPRDALWINAVRLDDGRRRTFGRDGDHVKLGEAVAASCAIPGFFEPVIIEGDRYVDGGVHSPTNLDLLGGLGLDLVIVSSPMSTAGRGIALSGSFAVRHTCRAMLDAEAIAVRRRGTPVVAFQPTSADQAVMGVNAMDPSRRAAVTAQVVASTRHRLTLPDVHRRLEPLAN